MNNKKMETNLGTKHDMKMHFKTDTSEKLNRVVTT